MSVPTPSSGEILGHYELIEQIGAGGMGVVFLAYDKKLQRNVALKVLPAGLLVDDEARRNFRKEALAVGKLTHPNIAMAFDFGEDKGVDYLVTEYVPGQNLDEKLARQPLSLRSVLDLGIQLASGLEAAHRENVIHRDLKPGNIRINPDGQLKILDFGLARLIEPVDEKAETANITTNVGITGTMPYMAPEVLRGEPADARADIWAAGAVLYEMATAKRAFPDRQASLVIDAILHYDPVRPSLINSEVTQPLETVILKALDREPDRRYQSARELKVDLTRIQHGEELATETLRRTQVMKVERRRRIRKWTFILGGVLLFGVAVGYAVRRWWPQPPSAQQQQQQAQRIMAVLPFDTVGQDPATSALGMGLTETLTAKLVQASDTDMIQVVSPRDLRDQGVKTAEEARREFGTDFVLESSLQRSGKTIRVNTYLVDSRTHRQLAARSFTVDAGDAFGLQDRVVSEALDMLPAQINREQRQKLAARQDTQPAAYEAYIRGRGYLQEYEKPENIDNAITEFNQALKIDPNYAPAYAGLGTAYWRGFRPPMSRGKDWLTKASQNCEKALALAPDAPHGNICLGNVLYGTGQYEEAVKHFQRALNVDPSSDEALLAMADAYSSLGDPSAAESAYRKAISLRPNYWRVYSWLGIFYSNHNRYSEATEMFRKATELAPDNYRGYSNLGGIYVLQGRYPEAVATLKRSIELRPTAEAYSNLGYAYTLMHQYADAAMALEQALKINDTNWMVWGNLADSLYWGADHRAQAPENYRRAITIASSKLQVNPRDALALAYLANYAAMINDREAAVQYLDKALELAPADGEVLFRAAIVYNHFGQTDKAILSLKRAVDAGYSRPVIKDTPDFQSLQQNPQFQALLGGVHS